MQNPSDYPLEKSEPPPCAAPAQGRSLLLWVVIIGGVVVIGTTFLFFRRAPPQPRTADAPTADVAAPAVVQPLGSAPEAIDVPPLGESDPLVRSLAVSAKQVVHSGGPGNNGGYHTNPVFLEVPPNESPS
jgi:hypothetical protein